MLSLNYICIIIKHFKKEFIPSDILKRYILLSIRVSIRNTTFYPNCYDIIQFVSSKSFVLFVSFKFIRVSTSFFEFFDSIVNQNSEWSFYYY